MTNDDLNILKNLDYPTQERLNALLSLVQTSDETLIPELEEILQDTTEDPDIRSAAALALGKLSGEKSFQILKAFCEDANQTVRHYVIQALGMTHYEAAAPLLINALKDQNNTVFAAASQALGDLGKVVVPYLIDLLHNGAEDARCVAAWQLGEAKAYDAVPSLVEAIRNEKNVSVIALCIWALGEIGMGSQEVLEILAEAKRQSEPDVRLRAETAMLKIARHSN